MKHLIFILGPAMSGKTHAMMGLGIDDHCLYEELQPDESPSEVSRILKRIETCEEFMGVAAITVTGNPFDPDAISHCVLEAVRSADWTYSFIFPEFLPRDGSAT